MKAAVLDFYDDMGETLRRVVPSQDLIPEFVKTAEVITRNAHPNQFALVMVDGDQSIPRFPVSDPGNAWLSALYFHGTHESLTGEAQKTAATLIKVAMESFGMPVTDVIADLADDEPPHNNVVDITGKRPAAKIRDMQDEDTRREVQYALDSSADGSKLYPLADAENAKTAAAYFSENKHAFSFRERREFSVKTAAALDKAGLPINEDLQKYAGAGYSPRLQAFIDVRHHWLLDTEQPEAAEHLRKMAAQKDLVHPETFAQSLEKFDRDVGLDRAWDSHIPDPWYSTFFMNKQASKASAEDQAILDLAKNRPELVEEAFGHHVKQAFCKEPVAVFHSMPTPQKKVLSRLAGLT
jgi:hypothetical protein